MLWHKKSKNTKQNLIYRIPLVFLFVEKSRKNIEIRNKMLYTEYLLVSCCIHFSNGLMMPVMMVMILNDDKVAGKTIYSGASDELMPPGHDNGDDDNDKNMMRMKYDDDDGFDDFNGGAEHNITLSIRSIYDNVEMGANELNDDSSANIRSDKEDDGDDDDDCEGAFKAMQ